MTIDTLRIGEEIRDDLTFGYRRKGSLSPELQVLTAWDEHGSSREVIRITYRGIQTIHSVVLPFWGEENNSYSILRHQHHPQHPSV